MESRKKCEETEKVYGDQLLQWAYGSKLGGHLLSFLSRPELSRLYGWIQSSTFSRFKINRFIKDFHIPMEDYEEKSFSSFNDFFIRKFREGKRNFSSTPSDFCAPAEGRYLAFDRITPTQTFPVKGTYLKASDLLGDNIKAQPFMEGPLVIARLCPVDYHRFHFPDSGEVLERYTISGELHSVNPIALKTKEDIFIKNERQVTILKTKNFGKIAFIEVGAMMVGKIVQTYSGIQFFKGQEKGYFLFGGSTVVILGEPGRLRMSSDILEKSKNNQECFIKLGEVIATT
ncbi:MAG: phosphatidylserine decarboxylase [Deltaproteobacteria bacterium]|nr:MAG: phosphatidylserine decarboxylase [Deltaproteobacteria bacterium]